MIEVRTLDFSALESLRSEWIALLPDERWALFAHPAWCVAIWESYHPGARIEFHVAYEGDRIVGILPVCHRRMNRFGLFLPIADAFTGGRADYTVPPMDSGDPSRILAPLIDSALSGARRDGALVVSNIPVETGIPDAIEGILEARNVPFKVRESHCLRLEVLPTVEETEQALSKKLRSDLRRRVRRLEESLGSLEFEVAQDREQVLELLPGYFEMHSRRWIEAGLPAMFTDASARECFTRLATDLWDDGLYFSTLRAGDQIVAHLFGMISNGDLLVYKSAFDFSLSELSPGKIQRKLIIDDAARRGLRGVDFLQGREPYKRHWTTEDVVCRTYVIRTHKISPTYAWITRGRPWAEHKVGGAYRSIESRIQAWRRR